MEAAPQEMSRERRVSTAQLEYLRIHRQILDRPKYAGLQSRSLVDEGSGEGLVEFAIDLQETISDLPQHARIIAVMTKQPDWHAARRYTPEHLAQARRILEEVRAGGRVSEAVRDHPLPDGGYVAKHVLVHAYRELTEAGEWNPEPQVLGKIRMKPTRTLSGVTTVTVLTKPYPCPGKCVFCPTDYRMPKSYLPDEPGAMRALQHDFDPYQQTVARLEALHAIGHPTDKIELLILGGTWSAYRVDYQEWFVRRCLDGLNGLEAGSLSEAQAANENAVHRNVGLVIETRPDHIDLPELVHLRALGVTKVQLGAQSLDDRILSLNARGHTVEQTRAAARLLRAAGFKFVLHWMPNLLGATLESDRADFARLWDDPDLRPDEIKIYPCQLLANAELYDYWLRGEYRPYTTEQLIDLLAEIKPTIPGYCRVNRVIRDIPSTNVVEGNKRTSLRMDVQAELRRRGTSCRCVRCREVRGLNVDPARLVLQDLVYAAGGAEEHFLSFVTEEDRLAGFLRLSLPALDSAGVGLADLSGAALVRELHVYGQSLEVGSDQNGAAQHIGLGMRLMKTAEDQAGRRGYRRMAVISALGTRGYYRKLGYRLGETYMLKEL
jgi:elongator complex protein 3